MAHCQGTSWVDLGLGIGRNLWESGTLSRDPFGLIFWPLHQAGCPDNFEALTTAAAFRTGVHLLFFGSLPNPPIPLDPAWYFAGQYRVSYWNGGASDR